jgi:opacity protein-like surface antigen
VKKVRILATFTLATLAVQGPAAAADPAIPARQRPAKPLPHDWNGLYAGGHVGYGTGQAGASVLDR